MNYESHEVKQIIQNTYDNFTPVERRVADYFTNLTGEDDLASRTVAGKLFVSEATLSRFAKKCGYTGYREFIFDYVKETRSSEQEKDIGILSRQVKNLYQNLLEDNFKLLNENQMKRIALMLNSAKRVCVYGMGSSGYTAREFQLRYMRTGLYVEAFTDSQMIQMNAALLEPEDLVIGISLSGETKDVLSGIRLARKRDVKTILLTANKNTSIQRECDEILEVATVKDLECGTLISPQFPLLVMIDILYTYYFENDSYFKYRKHEETMTAILPGK